MDDFFNFLLAAATVVVFVSKLFKKETGKAADKTVNTDVPDEDTLLPHTVMPDSRHTASTPSRPAGKKSSPPSGKASRKASPSTPPYDRRSLQEPEQEPGSEFAIRSAEEARRAIVWSEILRRIEN